MIFVIGERFGSLKMKMSKKGSLLCVICIADFLCHKLIWIILSLTIIDLLCQSLHMKLPFQAFDIPADVFDIPYHTCLVLFSWQLKYFISDYHCLYIYTPFYHNESTLLRLGSINCVAIYRPQRQYCETDKNSLSWICCHSMYIFRLFSRSLNALGTISETL